MPPIFTNSAVVPSTFVESFGMAALEAAACGIPVIATRSGALPEVVSDGVTGTLVDPGDVTALGDAIVAYATEPHLRAQHGAAGHEWARERFNIAQCARAYLDLFAELDRIRAVGRYVQGIQYTKTRLVILVMALGIGAALWIWLKRTRTGMVIRAGVDDRAMVSALGINIQLTFALAFVVGSALAGFGGVIGGSFASLAPGVDANWLLYSLVVVIIGGMGSLGGAAIGALLLGLTTNFSAAYLPENYTYYSIIFTFVLVAIVLAVRPLGLFGRPA